MVRLTETGQGEAQQQQQQQQQTRPEVSAAWQQRRARRTGARRVRRCRLRSGEDAGLDLCTRCWQVPDSRSALALAKR